MIRSENDLQKCMRKVLAIPNLKYLTKLKSSKSLNALELFSFITSEGFQLTHRYRYQFVGEVMADMRSIKEMIQCATLGIPKGIEKFSFYFYCFLP